MRLRLLAVASAVLNGMTFAQDEPPVPPEPPVEEEEEQVPEPEPVEPEPVPEPAEPEPVPEPETTPPPPPPNSGVPKETEGAKNRRLLREKVEENQHLKNSGHNWQLGAWMYGDLDHGVIHENHLTAHGCADHCEADERCYHWVYYLDSGRCDMKTNGGSLDSDTDHMIVGHSKRFLEYEKSEAGKRREL